MLGQRLARLGHASYDGLERLFRERTDPWHFTESDYEQARFAKMLAMVRTVPHRRILEAGCAEGHFTELLLGVADTVTAIDLSADAIARARERAPAARILQSKLEDLPLPCEPYDLVVCGEMLYYVADLKLVLGKLRGLGRYLLTCTCYPAALPIDRQLATYTQLGSVLHLGLRELRASSIRLWQL
jgi:2-polyprenyl-3-methyl-5-hydroxy-6-metoxy-1,4-benzoquinol methylase